MPENENGNGGDIEDAAEEIAEEIAEAVEDEIAAPETDVDVTIIEAPEAEEPEAKFASVDVGDLHVSGPAEMVETIAGSYLKDHIDHNPHPVQEQIEETAADITPDVIEEQIEESAAGETVDAPPGPTDWLFRRRGGR